MMGTLQVSDVAYMAALHSRGVKPLDLGRGSVGKTELHHGKNPEPHSKRRDNDATVVPLTGPDHKWVEWNPNEERKLQRLFSLRSAFGYWCWVNGERRETEEDARAFGAWVQENMHTETDELPEQDHAFVAWSGTEETNLEHLLSLKAAFSCWCRVHDREGGADAALAFQLWVLEKMEEEFNAS